MTKQEINRINKEIRVERSLCDYFYKKWIEEDDEHAYLLYQIHDYCLYVLENRIK